MQHLRVAGAQINFVVGDIEGNERLIAAAMDRAEAERADVLVVSELAITGYPPEDLLLREAFVEANWEALHRLAARAQRTVTVVGFVDRVDARAAGDAVTRKLSNAAALLYDGAVRGIYHKVLLPDYGVFDETRYFSRGGDGAVLWGIAGVGVGVSICEDIWAADGPPALQAENGAQILLNLNASPFHYGKAEEREAMLADRARTAGLPVVYVNQVGGQDELVFDGASLIMDHTGAILHRSQQFAEDFFVVDVPVAGARPVRTLDAVSTPGFKDRSALAPAEPAPLLQPVEAEIYAALTVGLRDYVTKNHFDHVVMALSGGIDSALTAAIATDALGAGSVWGVGMPTRFSSQGSVADAADLARRLGIRFDLIPIDDVYAAYLEALAPVFKDAPFDVAEENLQARIRGAVVMALSNKYGGIVVTTGNKSELAVGYATLYGDMVGGYSVLKDVFKTSVYDLCRWRNRQGEVIPQSIIDKPPSAELRPDQLDSDSLPPYDLLDEVLRRYVEEDRSIASIVAEGFESELVARVAGLVDRNEYKRRQAAPGVKITTKAFGKDRRLPITNRYRLG